MLLRQLLRSELENMEFEIGHLGEANWARSEWK